VSSVVTSPPSPSACGPATARRGWLLLVPAALAAALFAFLLLPRVHGNPRLALAFAGVGTGLLAWYALLAVLRRGALTVELLPVLKQHYVQASVQVGVYAYWGWYWRDVYAEAPLILAQLVFLYAFDALLSWSRGRSWRLGCGPLPIVLSTNVFIWFRDDWFLLQFGLVALGALGKSFLTWEREGRRSHIFNPSAFTLSVFSLGLLATNTTHLTFGVDIATTIFRPPHIYLEIFLLGLIVQYLFSTVLVTLSAAAVLVLLNVVYTAQTGVYHFIDTNISAAVFLGIHLLVTDPATSPRTGAGKVVFGALYGLSIWILYAVLGSLGLPQFYDKLLPIPLLNLLVPAIDRLARSSAVERLLARARALPARTANLTGMACWAALFGGMLGTGFIESPHEGRSLAFWRKAWDEGRAEAGPKMLHLLGTRIAKDSGTAHNALGSLLMEGELVGRDPARAAYHFALGCEFGSQRGCLNVVRQYLLFGGAWSEEALARALEHLEQRCRAGPPEGPEAHAHEAAPEGESADEEPEVETDPRSEACFLLGVAHERGVAGPADPAQAFEHYLHACAAGNLDAAKAVARSPLTGEPGRDDVTLAVPVLEQACAAGDADACLLAVFVLDGKHGRELDEARAQAALRRACELGSKPACEALQAGQR
jgi:TPR repeat protein